MDALGRFIVERMRCRFHPYLSPNVGWRRYPPHMAKLLKMLNPLHVISVREKIVAVDGAYVKGERPLREKYSIARDAASVLFGEVEDMIGIGFNLEVSFHSSGIASISLYWGSVWHLVPSTPLKLPRFAYEMDPNREGAPLLERREAGVKATSLISEERKAELRISDRFFVDPKPENAATFGDLCFLTQMREKWNVIRTVSVDISIPSDIWIYDGSARRECIAEVLRSSVGLKRFVSHGLMELVIRGRDDPQIKSWRTILKLLEKDNPQLASLQK